MGLGAGHLTIIVGTGGRAFCQQKLPAGLDIGPIGQSLPGQTEQSKNLSSHIGLFQMTRDQAQNACDGGLHIACDTKNKRKSRNLNSAPSARVITPGRQNNGNVGDVAQW